MFNRFKSSIFLLSISLSIGGCNSNSNKGGIAEVFKSLLSIQHNDTISSQEMLTYIVNPKNGLIKKKEINEFLYQIKYKPVDYIISQEAAGASITKEDYLKKTKDLDGLQYFDFRIEVDGITNELLKYKINSTEEYEKRIKYVAFNMQHDFKLIEGKDTLDCVIYHMERAYDVVPYTTVLLGFKKTDTDPFLDKTIVFEDNLFNNGLIKFTFIPADITQIPNLKII